MGKCSELKDVVQININSNFQNEVQFEFYFGNASHVWWLCAVGFDCRCGGQFCSVHRYSDMHECSFDYRQLAQSEIRKHNPVVAAEKITKI